jgi:glucan biosynthesis protein
VLYPLSYGGPGTTELYQAATRHHGTDNIVAVITPSAQPD